MDVDALVLQGYLTAEGLTWMSIPATVQSRDTGCTPVRRQQSGQQSSRRRRGRRRRRRRRWVTKCGDHSWRFICSWASSRPPDLPQASNCQQQPVHGGSRRACLWVCVAACTPFHTSSAVLPRLACSDATGLVGALVGPSTRPLYPRQGGQTGAGSMPDGQIDAEWSQTWKQTRPPALPP